MPHEREVVEICKLVFEAYQDETGNFLGLVITDKYEHARYLLKKIHDSTLWDTGRVHIHREGVEVKGGGKILVRTMSQPGMLMGLKPTKIMLFGNIGEMYYWMLSRECEIVGVA